MPTTEPKSNKLALIVVVAPVLAVLVIVLVLYFTTSA